MLNRGGIRELLALSGFKLLPHQEEAISWIKKHKRVIIADPPRVGKTAPVAVAMEELESYPALIVCPSIAIPVWEKMMGLLGRSTVRLTADTVLDTRDDKKVFLLNYEKIQTTKIRQKINYLNLKSVIIDEAHRFKNLVGSRLISLEACLRWETVLLRIAITGTPVVTASDDLISLLQLVGRIDDVGGRKSFVHQFGTNKLPSISKFITNGKDIATKAIFSELNQLLTNKNILLKRSFEDIGLNVTNINRTLVKLVGGDTGEIDREFIRERMEKWGYNEATRENAPLDLNYLNGKVFASSDRLSGSFKITYCILYALKLLEEGKKVIIFGWHVDHLSKIASYFNTLPIYGLTSQDKKNEIIKNFQDGISNVIVLNHKSGGEGIDLSMGNDVVLFEPFWTMAVNLQSERRIINSQKLNTTCTAHYLMNSSQVDRAKLEVLQYRLNLSGVITGENDTQLFDNSIEFKG